jgi:3-hydroxyacyl-[acyl-carrier-protein] dehydratase
MRWFWIDRFIEFESGKHATSIKSVSLAEEQVHDHFPSAPIMPNSLILEGMALTGGLLAAEAGGWKDRVVLAKVAKAKFLVPAVPGDLLTYRARLDDRSDSGAVASITGHIGDVPQADVQVFFAYVDESFAGKSLFKPGQLYDMLRVWQLFEVGKAADGSPLRPTEALIHDGE